MSTTAPTPTPAPEPTTDQLEESFEDELFPPLTLNDRCDADSSEAAVAQVMVSGEILHFCGHHFRANAEALSKFPHKVADEESKPFTQRRAQELGSQSRSQGDDHA